MKREDTIGVLETLLPEGYVKNHAFPPGWGGGFSQNKEVSTEVADVLEQYIEKHQNAEKTVTVHEQSVDWLESVWSEEALQRDAWGKWVLDCAKNPEELKDRVKALKGNPSQLKRLNVGKSRGKDVIETLQKETGESEPKGPTKKGKTRNENAEQRRNRHEEREEEKCRDAKRRERAEEARLKRQAEVERQKREKEAEYKKQQALEAEQNRFERRQLEKKKQMEAEARQKAAWAKKMENLHNWDMQKWKLKWTWFLGVALIAVPLLEYLFRRHGFDVALTQTQEVWPWCWWHLKFEIGWGIIAGIVLVIVLACEPMRDKELISYSIYEEKVLPMLERFFIISVIVTITMLICSIWHTFGALGFAPRSFGVSLFLIGAYIICGGISFLAFSIINGILWHRYWYLG